MPKYAIFDESGAIVQVVVVDAEHIEAQLQEGQSYLESEDVNPEDSIDLETMTVVRGTMFEPPENPPLPEVPEYIQQRQSLYPPVEEQLDMLFHAVKNGVALQDSDWFIRLQTIKDAIPKNTSTDPTIVYGVDPIPEDEE